MFQPIKIEILNNEIYLDKECWACKHEELKDEKGVCRQCNGTGYSLTNTGQAFLNLIKRHMGASENE